MTTTSGARAGSAPLRRLLPRLRSTWRTPLYRSSYSLLLTTAANAALGMAFWVAAARLYPADVVGLGAGGISALQLAGTVGWVGLQYTLMRYVPVSGDRTARFVGVVYAVGCTAALLAAVVTVVLAVPLEVPFLAADPASIALFCAGVVVWVVFSLQDAALVGIRRPLYVPAENAAYGALKLALLVALAGLVHPWTLLGVWVGTALVMTVVVNHVMFRSLLRTGDRPLALPPRRTVVRFSAGHSAVALASWVPELLVPLLVLRYLGDADNAYYYAAWTIAFSVKLLLTGMASALTVEAAYADHPFRALARSAGRLAAVVLLPAVGALVLGADLVLLLFGTDYATAAPVLRFLALSILPSAVVALVVALDMARERFGTALFVTATGTSLALVADVVLLPAMGITGAGVGWLIGQCVAAALGVATLLLPRRGG
jgi:O-antigen/teichoic acid export membrane protein